MKTLCTILILGVSCLLSRALAQEAQEPPVSVVFKVADVGTYELDVLIRDNEAFVPAVQTFSIIGIKADTGATQREISGFLRSADSTYTIDIAAATAIFADHRINVTSADYILRGSTLYLSTKFMRDLFGLDMRYLPRRLLVELRDTRQLPVFLTSRRRSMMMRRQLSVNIPEPEISYDRRVDVLSGTRLDWSFASRFSKQSFGSSRYSLNLGAMMFGGEVTGRLVGTASPHRTRNQWRGRIRFPFFGQSYVRQLVIGDFVSFGLLPREVTGVEVTNRPAAIRHIFTREVFSGQFEPNIDVALTGGVEGFQLQQTDETGGYILDAPVLYGQGLLEVHAYDPWGQERTLRYRMNVPRSLIPPGELEYSLSFGRFRPPSNMLMSANYLSWGVTSDLTIGTKLDFYDATGDIPKAYAGLTATARVTRSLILNAIVVPTAYTNAAADWIFPSSAQITLSHNRFARNTLFNPSRMLDETNLALLFPISFNTSRLTLSGFASRRHFNEAREDEIQLSVGAVLGNLSPRVSHRIVKQKLYNDGTLTASNFTDFSLGMLLPANVLFRADVNYNHINDRVESINGDVVKRFSNGLLFGISYYRLPVIETYNIGFRVEYYFPVARAQAAVITSGTGVLDYAVAGNGSIGFSVPTSEFFAMNRSNYVGFGGFVVHPFLDENGNGIADKGEPAINTGKVFFENLSAGGQTRMVPTNKLAGDKIAGYEEFNLFLDPQSLENPIWVPKYGTIRLISEPNYIQRIDIPVINGGFVRGIVTIADGVQRPAEGIKLTLKSVGQRGTTKTITKTTSTFSTGEFEFSTVPPGRYTLELDAAQLATLGYNATPPGREIVVLSKPEGDVVADQDFRLTVR